MKYSGLFPSIPSSTRRDLSGEYGPFLFGAIFQVRRRDSANAHKKHGKQIDGVEHKKNRLAHRADELRINAAVA